MAGKKKDPNKTYSPKWGGEYRGGGPKPSPYPLHILKIACTDEELQTILNGIKDTRRRAEILLGSSGN